MKQVQIALAVLLLAVAGVMVWQVLLLREPALPNPVYQGKHLSQWLDDLNSPTPGLAASAKEAIRQMGTNAVPLLLRKASRHNSLPKALLIELLKRQSFVNFHFESDSDHQSKALRGLYALGQTGALGLAEGFTNSDKWIRFGCVGQWEMAKDYPSILLEPLFTRLKDPEPMVRARAANALGMLHQQPDRVVPALMELLHDQDDWVRCMAALGLSLYGDRAKSAVPAISKLLSRPDPQFEFFGTNAVKAIDPAAAAKAGIR